MSHDAKEISLTHADMLGIIQVQRGQSWFIIQYKFTVTPPTQIQLFISITIILSFVSRGSSRNRKLATNSTNCHFFHPAIKATSEVPPSLRPSRHSHIRGPLNEQGWTDWPAPSHSLSQVFSLKLLSSNTSAVLLKADIYSSCWNIHSVHDPQMFHSTFKKNFSCIQPSFMLNNGHMVSVADYVWV